METVLITGANKGIGFESARQLAKRGFHVLLASRDAARGAAAVEKLRAEGLEEVALLELDVTNEQSIQHAASAVQQRFGSLDVLINNAGIAIDIDPPSTTKAENIRTTFETNFLAPIAVTQAFLPLLKQSNHARIILVSSGLGSHQLHHPAGEFKDQYYFSYSASKSALNMFGVQLARELQPENIRVNIVCPGYTATDLNNNAGTQTLAEGTEAIVTLATEPSAAGTARYINRHGPLPW